MTDRFHTELTAGALQYVLLTGPHEARLRTATTAVDAVLPRGSTFSDPVPAAG